MLSITAVSLLRTASLSGVSDEFRTIAG
jgi:hypothetical protein